MLATPIHIATKTCLWLDEAWIGYLGMPVPRIHQQRDSKGICRSKSAEAVHDESGSDAQRNIKQERSPWHALITCKGPSENAVTRAIKPQLSIKYRC